MMYYKHFFKAPTWCGVVFGEFLWWKYFEPRGPTTDSVHLCDQGASVLFWRSISAFGILSPLSFGSLTQSPLGFWSDLMYFCNVIRWFSFCIFSLDPALLVFRGPLIIFQIPDGYYLLFPHSVFFWIFALLACYLEYIYIPIFFSLTRPWRTQGAAPASPAAAAAAAMSAALAEEWASPPHTSASANPVCPWVNLRPI